MQCINCSSDDLKKLGMRFSEGKEKNLGYSCNNCGETFTVPYSKDPDNEVSDNDDLKFIRDDEFISNITKHKRIVFTCALNNTKVNKKFLGALKSYCSHNDAALVILPIRYRNPSLINTVKGEGGERVWYAPEIEEYLVENNFEIIEGVKALGGLKTQATVINPLSGVDSLSKGNTVILGHPQVALKTIARNDDNYPAIATTTGAITEKFYSSTKAGYKAAFNHSLSAAVFEIDDQGDHFIRHLNFDGNGFYDIKNYYRTNKVNETKNSIQALVTGDEHAVFADAGVRHATYDADDSISNTLKPKYIVRHDVLDFFSASHHHKYNIFLKYAKHHSEGQWSVKTELMKTVNYINDTTKDFSTNIIIASNHNEALNRWLNECNPKEDPENALLYHALMYGVLSKTKLVDGKLEQPEPFELFAASLMKQKTMFLSRNQEFKVAGVELSMHGDQGVNGSRGSSVQFGNLPDKNITGHSHSPMINKSNYTVGTSSILRLEYNSGPSTWDHAHCIIYPNGKRQMLFIRNGKWKA